MANVLMPSPCFPSLRAWCAYCKGSAASLNNLRRAFTLLARTSFAHIPENEEYKDALSCRTYTDNPETNKISIEPASVINPGNTQNVPGVLVAVPEGFQFERKSLSPVASHSPDFASSSQITMGTATVTFTCRDTDADMACLMADLLMLTVMAARDAAMDAWRTWLLDYEVMGQTEPKLVKQEDDTSIYWYESVVTLKLSLAWGARVSVESKRMTGATLAPVMQDGTQFQYIPCPK